jgi:hypothetical protein
VISVSDERGLAGLVVFKDWQEQSFFFEKDLSELSFGRWEENLEQHCYSLAHQSQKIKFSTVLQILQDFKQTLVN